MKVKVLHIIKSLGRGGAETLLQETLGYHDKEKFEFHYIYFLPWKNQMVSGIQQRGGIVINISAKRNLSILFQVKKIQAYIMEHDIKLVHCHLPWAGFVGRLIYKLIKVPVIYTEHNKQERYHWVTRVLNKFSFNYQTKVIAVSNDVAVSINKNIKPQIPVDIIHNGVSTDYFIRNADAGKKIREEYGVPVDSPVIGTIAVFRFQKRLKEWIDIFASVEKQFEDLHGIIVGDGILNREIREYVKEKGLEKKIIMPGLQHDVLPWLSAMDIFMMSSEFEGLPIALLEAMSMQCAVVCTDAGGIGELVRNFEDGFLVPVNKWKELEKPITCLLTGQDEIYSWGNKARQRVEQSFSMQRMVEQTEKIYSALLN